MYAKGDVVNNGYATYKVIKDLGVSASLHRLDIGKRICRDPVTLQKSQLHYGDLRKAALEIDFV
jgi:hypothetical protein